MGGSGGVCMRIYLSRSPALATRNSALEQVTQIVMSMEGEDV